MFRSCKVFLAQIGRACLLSSVLLVAACGSPEERAQGYYERGMKLLSAHDYVKASIEFKNALQLKKDLVGAWRGLEQIEEQNQNWASVHSLLETIVELDANDAESRVKLGHLMLNSNQLDKALDLANAAELIDNRNAKTLALRAAVLFGLNDRTRAKQDATAALELEPSNAEALAVLAAERYARGDAQGALTILNREPATHVNNIGIQLFKVKVLDRLGDTQQAEAVFRQLIVLNPKQTALRAILVKYLVAQKRQDDAEKELRAWAAAFPDDVETELNLVRFLHTSKGADAARQELAARIAAGGKVFQYQLALAEFEFAQGNITQSIQSLEKLTSSASREDASAAKIKLAEINLNQKNFDAADKIVAEILGKDDRNIGALKLRASVRLERRQLDEAIADLRQALNDQPRSAELMLLLASAYERSGAMELADKQYADATKAADSNVAVGLDYVTFLQRRGDLARAEDTLIELARRSPKNIKVLSTLAQLRLTRQNWIGAQEVAETIRRIGDNGTLADQIAGVALSAGHKFGESVAVLERAYAEAPASLQGMVALVNALERAGKVDQAATFLQKALEANPDNTEARVLLGSIQLVKNDPEQAVNSFRAAIERQPKNVEGYRALANFYIRQKKKEDALKVIRAGLEQQPDSFALRLTLGGVLELNGNYEAAIAEYETLLKQHSGSPIVANNLASLLSDHRTDKASLERAYSLAASLRKSPVPSFKDTLGWIYHLRGDYKAAISLLEEATAAEPDRAAHRYHLGMSYLADGQLAKAAEQLKKARELAPDNKDLQSKIRAAQEKAAI